MASALRLQFATKQLVVLRAREGATLITITTGSVFVGEGSFFYDDMIALADGTNNFSTWSAIYIVVNG